MASQREHTKARQAKLRERARISKALTPKTRIPLTDAQRRAKANWEAKAGPEEVRRIRRESAKRCRYAMKLEMIEAYGGGCTCCGETVVDFLAMDHVKGRTATDDFTGYALWRHARKLGWPDTYTVLCHNCNLGKHLNDGVCPHERQSTTVE